MFREKPKIAVYNINPELAKQNNEFYLNAVLSTDGHWHSFRCPNEECGRAVRIGDKRCPFCRKRLKWESPFDRIYIM